MNARPSRITVPRSVARSSFDRRIGLPSGSHERIATEGVEETDRSWRGWCERLRKHQPKHLTSLRPASQGRLSKVLFCSKQSNKHITSYNINLNKSSRKHFLPGTHVHLLPLAWQWFTNNRHTPTVAIQHHETSGFATEIRTPSRLISNWRWPTCPDTQSRHTHPPTGLDGRASPGKARDA